MKEITGCRARATPTASAWRRALARSLARQAVALNERPPGPMLMSEWVRLELGDALAAPTGREQFTRLVATLRAQPDVEIVPASHESFVPACAFFAQRPDKAWSLTDCTLFVVMRERDVTAALTADQHFEQAEPSGGATRWLLQWSRTAGNMIATPSDQRVAG